MFPLLIKQFGEFEKKAKLGNEPDPFRPSVALPTELFWQESVKIITHLQVPMNYVEGV